MNLNDEDDRMLLSVGFPRKSLNLEMVLETPNTPLIDLRKSEKRKAN
jgi:hypothetical protein